MRGQTFAQLLVAILFCAFLSACGGGGPQFCTTGNCSGSSSSSSSSSGGGSSSGSSSGTTTTAAHVILASSSPTLAQNGSASSTVSLTATVTDSNNVTISGYPVAFTADGGALTPNASVTDANGNISATLSAGNAAPGVIINVSATASPLAAVSVPVKVASTTPSYALGVLSTTGTFTAGAISIGQTPLAAGGSSGLQVSLVDTANGNTPFSGAVTVNFSSPCQSQGLAQITSPVTNSTGTVASTYKATGCSGNDTITASVLINGSTISASGTINVQAATLGSLQFVSANPTTIGLKGTGLNESSTILFKVVDSNGSPVIGQQIDFALTTTAGGLTVSPASAKSDASGNVQTTVQSGTIHTSVRVVATAHGTTLSTQSNQLTVSTGFPAQNAFDVSLTAHNIEGDTLSGNTTVITARLSDRFNNPVPDGTAVAFTTECGGVEPSCTTVDGTCSVTFTTKDPRTRLLYAPTSSGPQNPVYSENNCAANPHGLGCDDHRCTVLATAIGEESFFDCNGSGRYQSVPTTQCSQGDFFVSLPEAWNDWNENGKFDPDFETYVDFNKNGGFDAATGKFIGLLCSTDSTSPFYDPNCSGSSSLSVRNSQIVVMSSSDARISVSPNPITLSSTGSVDVSVDVSDDVGQNMAAGTVVSATTTYGSISGASSYVLPDLTGPGPYSIVFTIKGPGTPGTGNFRVDVVAPTSHLDTFVNVSVTGN